MLADELDEVVVADAQAQQEAAREGLVDGAQRVGHRHGVAGVDVGDAGGDLDGAGALEQPGGRHERVTPDGLGDPERPVAQLLGFSDELHALRRGQLVEHPRPDADASQVDASHAHGP